MTNPQYYNHQPSPQLKAAILLAIVGLMAFLLSGCSPRIIEHTSYQRDTLVVSKSQVDSVYKRDSIFVKEKNDTVYIYREKERIRYQIIRDTTLRVSVDSVVVERVKEVPVEKELTLLQRAKLSSWWVFFAATLALGGWTFRKQIFQLLKIAIKI